jgi:hypothetical protein
MPQLMPDGLLVTVPLPPPAKATDSMSLAVALKFAVTLVLFDIVTWQVPVPLHPPPDQPANVDPAIADAVSVTCVPLA